MLLSQAEPHKRQKLRQERKRRKQSSAEVSTQASKQTSREKHKAGDLDQSKDKRRKIKKEDNEKHKKMIVLIRNIGGTPGGRLITSKRRKLGYLREVIDQLKWNYMKEAKNEWSKT